MNLKVNFRSEFICEYEESLVFVFYMNEKFLMIVDIVE
jgi:hypothetical protein